MSMVLDGLSPRSRSTDPLTSVDAGRQADLNKSQTAILAAMRARGTGVAAFELEQFFPDMSPSRVRSAVAELAEQGLIEETGEKRLTRFGRQARVWELKARAGHHAPAHR